MNIRESEKLELKSSFAEWKEIIETLGAFANKNGGKIIIGLNDNGDLSGLVIGKGTLEDIINKIKNHSDPVLYPSVNLKTFGPGEIVEIEIKESDNKPVFVLGRGYIRIGKTNQKLSQAEIRDMIKKYSIPDFDQHSFKYPLKQLELDDKIIARMPAGYIKRIGLTKKNKITNAGYLCFVKQNRLMPNAVIKAARFKGNNMVKFIDMKDFDVNILRGVDDAIDFIKRHIDMEVVIRGKSRREEIWDYSITSLREAITNAVVHRDYADSGNVQIRIFDNRLEIWSPGLLPKELNVTNLLQESRSIPKNRIIAQVFHDAEMMEGWGTGFQRIVEGCKKNGNRVPLFQEKTGAFVVIFLKRIKGEGVNGGASEGVNGGASEGVNGGASEGVNGGASEGVNLLLKHIKSHPGQRSAQISRSLAKPKRTIERWLSDLKKENKIEFQGSSKTGGYFSSGGE